MSQPIVADWWAAMDPNHLALIFRLAAENPNTTSSSIWDQQGRPPGEMVRVLDDRLPGGAEQVFGGRDHFVGKYREAYLFGFRVWLRTHPQGLITADWVDTRWSLISDLANLGDDTTKIAFADAVVKIRPAFLEYVKDLRTALRTVAKSMSDPSVTGAWKDGRWIADHSGDEVEERNGERSYRTREGYLAVSNSSWLHMGVGVRRGEEDWTIAMLRAVRHSQAESLVAVVIDGVKKDSATGADVSVYRAVGRMRDTSVRLLIDVKLSSVRPVVLHEFETWNKVGDDKKFKNFAEIPRYAANRFAGTWGMVQRAEGMLREFSTGFDAQYEKRLGPTPTVEDVDARQDEVLKSDGGKSLDEFFAAGRLALVEYLNAVQAVYECVVECCERFCEWVLDWTRDQLEKDFQNENFKLWALIRGARVLLTAASFTTAVVVEVLSLGTLTFIAIPVFMAADVLMDKIEKHVVDRHVDRRVSELESKKKLDEFLGVEVVTAKDKAMAKLSKAMPKIVGIAESAKQAEDARGAVTSIADTPFELIKAVSKAKSDKAVDTLQKNIRNVLDPVSNGGPAATAWAGIATSGLALVLEGGGTAINLVVPPQVVDTVSPEGKDMLKDVWRLTLATLDDDEQLVLRGALDDKAVLRMRVVEEGGTFRGKIVNADGTDWKVTVDRETLRTHLRPSRVFRILLHTWAERRKRLWGVAVAKLVFDDDHYVYLRAEQAEPIAEESSGPYDPVNDDHSAIVRFTRADLVRHFVERDSRFTVEVARGVMLDGLGEEIGGTAGDYQVVLTTEGDGHYVGPRFAPTQSEEKKAARLATSAKVKAVLAHQGVTV